ncbi:vacuolar protein sorting-associated protein 37B-like isoform X1 [Gadus macrocephalus]|uniref:vacuolar protein sorting-associated protein 37B-like isoform X1 n=1 Tax=Gadus macrocephalus TaxID=80720 RepID=UPI0028CB9FAF|nr:vacuolar protein sorting-associated protein 37B-like isoform X1 [Gadus macrocephalus]
MSAQFGFLRIAELRRLLQDEEKCNAIIRYSEKFQSLKSAIENILVSNHRLAKASLFHKPAFRDTKRLLAMKYKELEKLMGNIRAKLSYLGKLKLIFNISNIFSNYVLATLAYILLNTVKIFLFYVVNFTDEKYTGLLHMVQLSLVKNILSVEQESEALLQRFVDGETPVGDFLEGFLHLRKLYHVRQVLRDVTRDMVIARRTPGSPAGVGTTGDPRRFVPPPAGPLSHPRCDRFCSLAPVLVLPAIGRSLAPPPSGALGRREAPPRGQGGSYWVHHHHHHHHLHHHQHHLLQQHQQRLRCSRRGRKPARLQKPQTPPGRRGPGLD